MIRSWAGTLAGTTITGVFTLTRTREKAIERETLGCARAEERAKVRCFHHFTSFITVRFIGVKIFGESMGACSCLTQILLVADCCHLAPPASR